MASDQATKLIEREIKAKQEKQERTKPNRNNLSFAFMIFTELVCHWLPMFPWMPKSTLRLMQL